MCWRVPKGVSGGREAMAVRRCCWSWHEPDGNNVSAQAPSGAFVRPRRGMHIVRTGVSVLPLILCGSTPYVLLLTRIHGAASSG